MHASCEYMAGYGAGSCWAFSAVGAVESINAIWTGNLLNLSEQQVLDCSDGGDCSWGYPSKAFNYAISNGITLAADYPSYDAKKHTCRFNQVRTRAIYHYQ